MTLNALQAISPVDGRYRAQCEPLAPFFSESGLIRYRLRVEIEYFIALCRIPLPPLASFDKKKFPALRALYLDFGLSGAEAVKRIEKKTNHDVKAVEYYLKDRFHDLGLDPYREFIHFGLTSQDVNNTAVPLSLKEALEAVYLPALDTLAGKLHALAASWKDIPMLAHTHGQPASPTTLGKEVAVFYDRLQSQRAQLKQVPFAAKFGGATGNFNAHVAAYPKRDWPAFADAFVHRLGLVRSQVTTQIDHYDQLAALCDALKRINTILIDLCRDVWTYVSMNYFSQAVRAGETGSSAMPHKVNPIDFENAEGNLGLANALFAYLSGKLPVSRLQRDLTDSTTLRNIGVPLAHTVLAFGSLVKGLGKIKADKQALHRDLENNWAVVAEAIQTILRREGMANPYEALKALTRGNKAIGRKEIAAFIDGLDVSPAVRKELHAITPHNYTGVFRMP